MTDDWLFGEPPPEALIGRRDGTVPIGKRQAAWWRNAQRRVAGMVSRFGKGPADTTCKGCVHLLRVGYHDGSYLKCENYSQSASEATDWRAGWPACGAYEPSPPKETRSA